VKVIWSPHALQQLDEIISLIARDRPRAAESWLESVKEAVSHITAFPRQGRMVPEKRRADLRQVQHPPYRIIYRLDSKRIVILSLRHGRRAWNPADVQSP
jgi:toxin ParE1/3/4